MSGHYKLVKDSDMPNMLPQDTFFLPVLFMAFHTDFHRLQVGQTKPKAFTRGSSGRSDPLREDAVLGLDKTNPKKFTKNKVSNCGF